MLYRRRVTFRRPPYYDAADDIVSIPRSPYRAMMTPLAAPPAYRQLTPPPPASTRDKYRHARKGSFIVISLYQRALVLMGASAAARYADARRRATAHDTRDDYSAVRAQRTLILHYC